MEYYEYPQQKEADAWGDKGGGAPSMEKAVEEAAALAKEGRHDEAVKACNAAIAGGRAGAQAVHAQRAASLEAIGRYDEALKACQSALKAPGDALGREAVRRVELLRGRLYMRMGKAAKAANHLERASRAAPGDPLLLAYSCLALILDDRHERALGSLRAAGDPSEHPAALAVAARALYETGMYKEAYEHCRKAFSADAQCSAAWLYAGMACDALGRADEAAAAYEKAAAPGAGGGDLAVDAGDSGRAHALCRTGRYGEAAELLAGAGASGSKDARLCCLAGMALSREGGRGEEAAAMLRAAASSRPANSDGLYYAALASYMLGKGGDRRRYDEALRSLRQALSRNRKSGRAEALAKKAREAIRAVDDRKKADIGRIVQAAREEESRRAAEARLARKGRGTGGGDEEGRRRDLKRRERERRRLEEEERRREELAAQKAASARAAELSREGRFEEVLDLFEGAAPRPDDRVGQDARARALYGLGRYGEAAECFGNAHPDGKESPDALVALAAKSIKEGRKRQFEEGHMAISHYNDALYRIGKALNADAGHHEALVLGGMVNMYTANIREMPDTSEDRALDMFESASRSDRCDAQALYHTGKILERRGESERAKGAYEAAGLCSARRLEDHYCIGRALDALGRFGDARRHYTEGIRRDPESRGIHGEITGGGGGGAHRRGQSDLSVVDTNVAMPCLVKMCAEGCDLPTSVTNKAYFVSKLTGGNVTAIVPWACKGEIVNNLGAFLSRMTCHSDHSHVIDSIKRALNDIPSERARGIRVVYADSLRVIGMYWRAWLDMSDDDKRGWQERKKANGRLAGGGPPEGAVDTKVLAIASKVAADQSKTVTLYSDDEDFGAFKEYIAGIGVDVKSV